MNTKLNLPDYMNDIPSDVKKEVDLFTKRRICNQKENNDKYNPSTKSRYTTSSSSSPSV